MFGMILGLVFFALMTLICGVLIGRTVENQHFRQLEAHEEAVKDFLVTQVKTFPGAVPGKNPPTLVCAEVVIASDYLKNFLASWRGFFGGEMKSYSRMTERAKREVIARLVQQAQALGYNAICNVRIETAEIGRAQVKGKPAMASCLGCATAYQIDPAASQSCSDPG